MTDDAVDPQAESVRKLARAMLRTALLPGLLTVAIAATIAAVAIGSSGLTGALVGGAVAFASSLLTIVLMRLSAGMPPMVVMAVAMGGYLLKLVALLVVLVLLRDVESVHTMSLGLTMLATIFVWAGAEVVAFKRTQIPTLIV